MKEYSLGCFYASKSSSISTLVSDLRAAAAGGGAGGQGLRPVLCCICTISSAAPFSLLFPRISQQFTTRGVTLKLWCTSNCVTLIQLATSAHVLTGAASWLNPSSSPLSNSGAHGTLGCEYFNQVLCVQRVDIDLLSSVQGKSASRTHI